MKRFHVHVSVDSIDDAVKFYSTMFGVPPVKLKPDYAKWQFMGDAEIFHAEKMPPAASKSCCP